MERTCTDYFNSIKVPKFCSPENFSLDKYVKEDCKEKKIAAAIDRGDYAEVIRLNMEKEEQPEPVAESVKYTEEISPIEPVLEVSLPTTLKPINKPPKSAYKGANRRMSAIGLRIDKLCQHYDVSIADIARATKKPTTTMMRATLENVKPQVATLQAYADFFRVSYFWLVTGKEL